MGADKRILLLVTVDEISIYVIRRSVSVYLRQAHSTVIVAKHIRVSIFRLIRSQSEKYIRFKRRIYIYIYFFNKILYYILGIIEGTLGRPLPNFRVFCYEPSAPPRVYLFDELFHGNGLKAKIPVKAVVVTET